MAYVSPSAPPTRLINWLQTVQEADPDWQQRRLRPVVYEFSNGRRFVWDPTVYTDTGP